MSAMQIWQDETRGDSGMSEYKNVSGDVADFIFDRIIMLPANLTNESQSRGVRVLGFVWHMIWFFPIGMACMPVLAVALIATVVEDTWRGHSS